MQALLSVPVLGQTHRGFLELHINPILSLIHTVVGASLGSCLHPGMRRGNPGFYIQRGTTWKCREGISEPTRGGGAWSSWCEVWESSWKQSWVLSITHRSCRKRGWRNTWLCFHKVEKSWLLGAFWKFLRRKINCKLIFALILSLMK